MELLEAERQKEEEARRREKELAEAAKLREEEARRFEL